MNRRSVDREKRVEFWGLGSAGDSRDPNHAQCAVKTIFSPTPHPSLLLHAFSIEQGGEEVFSKALTVFANSDPFRRPFGHQAINCRVAARSAHGALFGSPSVRPWSGGLIYDKWAHRPKEDDIAKRADGA